MEKSPSNPHSPFLKRPSAEIGARYSEDVFEFYLRIRQYCESHTFTDYLEWYCLSQFGEGFTPEEILAKARESEKYKTLTLYKVRRVLDEGLKKAVGIGLNDERKR